MSHYFHFCSIELSSSSATDIRFHMFIICYFKFWWEVAQTNDLNNRFDWFYSGVDQSEWLKLTIWLIQNKQIELKISKFLVCSFRNSNPNSLFISFVYESKLLKTSSVNSTLLNRIRSYLINIIVFRLRLEREQLNNLNLSTLLKICEKKNHIAVSRSQHMYIIFRMIDIRANTFWNSIALYSNENHDMFRRCAKMIAIFAIQTSCLTLKSFKLLQICDTLSRFD